MINTRNDIDTSRTFAFEARAEERPWSEPKRTLSTLREPDSGCGPKGLLFVTNRFALRQTGSPRWTAVSNKIKDFEKQGAPQALTRKCAKRGGPIYFFFDSLCI